ncbi:NADP-dependent oxidoreductase domain-containing protein [Aspergillus alliaceus]|uniref:NADP-dependent oxidoreductase domain-containing protein n=1 Tax=Petromyces alliaceus TaxID=209559 RepID=UPI0012A3B944|nr:NADP-dependent oxidoreductase domain-containing protein [Aspergillus alliaceus]KAB8228298.1 NADP-dependent oxidoreductase domain-containing protein [Aspergillus alliaceus]
MAITTESKTELKVVLGTMTLSKEARVHDPNDCATMLDAFQKHGYNEIDSARVYGVAHRAWLWALSSVRTGSGRPSLPGLLESLQALQGEKIDLWYLHARDHNTSYAEALEVVNELYKASYFHHFGISNYSVWEVAQICELYERSGWKKPDVYQGCYHALQRSVEPELFPCLRQYGIAFYSSSPVAGGCAHGQGEFRRRYWNEAYFSALDVIRPVAHKHGITTAEAAVRWANYPSSMKKEYSDVVITGASSAVQLEENLTNLEKGPLPLELVKAFDEGWAIVTGVCGPYFQWLSGLRIKFKFLIDCLL